jgi:4-amino-4-deoxy-L-arabinose transferase-like glycosyltransferase
MEKRNYGLLFILVASLALSLVYIPNYNPSSADKEIYRYIGRVIERGGVPYRDVFDHKPPLIFFLNYAAILLGGDWGQWLIDASLALLATLLFYRLCRRHQLVFPWLLPLLFNLMIRDHLLCLGMGMTREYTSMFLLLFFCVFMGDNRYRWYLLGALAGITFFMQQDQVLALLPFLCYALLEKETLPVLSRVLRASAGFGVIALPILLFFAWSRSLGYFWQDAFLFNFSWYTTTLKESFWDHVRKIKVLVDQGNYEVPFMVSMALGISALFFRSSNKKLILASLAAVLFSIATEFMGGRDIVPKVTGMGFTHYVLPLSASLPILLFSVFAFTSEPALREPKLQAVFGILLCASLSYTAVQHVTHLIPLKKDPTVASPIMAYLRQHRPGDYQLYEFGHNGYVYAYNELGIIGPSKWVYQHFWVLYQRWDRDNSILHSIADDLQRHQTTYVIDFTDRPGWFLNPTASPWWHAFLRQYYEPVLKYEPENAVLWKRKAAAE